MATASTFQPFTPVESTRRIQELDKELRALREEVKKLRQTSTISPKWWIDQAGRFENDPVFDEILRLGRETRSGRKRKSKGKRGLAAWTDRN